MLVRGEHLKWVAVSFPVAVLNLVLMFLYAEGFLGPSPVFLLVIFGFVSLGFAVFLGKAAFRSRKNQEPYWYLSVLVAAIYLGLIFFNIGILSEILYVS